MFVKKKISFDSFSYVLHELYLVMFSFSYFPSIIFFMLALGRSFFCKVESATYFPRLSFLCSVIDYSLCNKREETTIQRSCSLHKLTFLQLNQSSTLLSVYQFNDDIVHFCISSLCMKNLIRNGACFLSICNDNTQIHNKCYHYIFL